MAALEAAVDKLAHYELCLEIVENGIKQSRARSYELTEEIYAKAKETTEKSSLFAENAELKRLMNIELSLWKSTRCSGFNGCDGTTSFMCSYYPRMPEYCNCWESGEGTPEGKEHWTRYRNFRKAEYETSTKLYEMSTEISTSLLATSEELKSENDRYNKLQEERETLLKKIQELKSAQQRKFFETATVDVLETMLSEWSSTLRADLYALEIMLWALGADMDLKKSRCHCDADHCECLESIEVHTRASKPNEAAIAHFMAKYKDATAPTRTCSGVLMCAGCIWCWAEE